jgi:hypothetical protein
MMLGSLITYPGIFDPSGRRNGRIMTSPVAWRRLMGCYILFLFFILSLRMCAPKGLLRSLPIVYFYSMHLKYTPRKKLYKFSHSAQSTNVLHFYVAISLALLLYLFYVPIFLNHYMDGCKTTSFWYPIIFRIVYRIKSEHNFFAG